MRAGGEVLKHVAQLSGPEVVHLGRVGVVEHQQLPRVVVEGGRDFVADARAGGIDAALIAQESQQRGAEAGEPAGGKRRVVHGQPDGGRRGVGGGVAVGPADELPPRAVGVGAAGGVGGVEADFAQSDVVVNVFGNEKLDPELPVADRGLPVIDDVFLHFHRAGPVAGPGVAELIAQRHHRSRLVIERDLRRAAEVGGHGRAPAHVAFQPHFGQRVQGVGGGGGGLAVDGAQRHLRVGIGQRHRGVTEQGVVAVVGAALRKVVLRVHDDLPDAGPAAIGPALQHAVEKRQVEAGVGPGIDYAGGGEQADGAAQLRVINQGLLAGRGNQVRVVISGKVAGAGDQEGQPGAVLQGHYRGIGQNVLLRPAARTAVAQVVDYQGAVLKRLVDGALGGR